jgi:uncharacterized DUF497 family protein
MTIQTEKTTQIKDEIKINRTRIPTVNYGFRVCIMVFSATFENISVISWRSVLLVEGSRENRRPVASHWGLSVTSYQVYLHMGLSHCV